MDDAYFFDTYAIIEIIKGNQAYQEYKNASIVLTIFNIAELHYALLRDFSPQIAEALTKQYAQFIIEVDIEAMAEANAFKLKNKEKKYSVADCIGYTLANKLGLKFLTGDQGFKGLKGVEFVK